MKNRELCDSCGRDFPTEQLINFEGQALCPDCFQSATLLCARCGERIWQDENTGDNQTPLCQQCYDRYYTSCVRCGRIIAENDACYHAEDDGDEPYCQNCWEHQETGAAIHDYYFKPTPIFYGAGPRFLGVELEIDGAGEDSSSARSLLQVANNEADRMYCKHDGSLEEGFELVTHPMTLEYHQQKMPWAEVLHKAIDMGYVSHQAGTCGLHIHVDRTAFGDSEAQQDSCIARILYFFEKHWEELLKFSRRTPRQLEQWAARYGYKDQPQEILEHAKKGCHKGRYTCVNLTNWNTIEFRMFRGTLKYNTLMATLQLVDKICDVALCLSDEELKALSWTTFVSGCRSEELVQYLKERRLYVNEPMGAEEEV